MLEPRDHPKFIFEPKSDGFRALAPMHTAVRWSRLARTFKSCRSSPKEIAQAVSN